MLNADQKQTAQKALRELGIPAVAGVAAAGAGILWRRKPDVRSAVPDVRGGVGDLVDDLRGKLESVTGKGNGGGGGGSSSSSRDNDQSTAQTKERDPLAERRRAREQRRNQRRNKSGQ